MYSLQVMINGQPPVTLYFRTETAAEEILEKMRDADMFKPVSATDHFGQTLTFDRGQLIGTTLTCVAKFFDGQIAMMRLQQSAQTRLQTPLSPGVINLNRN